MLHDFIQANRPELISRCQARVATRRVPRPSEFELRHGIPTFIGQLEKMLATPPANGDPQAMEAAAAHHGQQLLRSGFTIDQAVHDYGDLCQAITQLADEQGRPIPVADFAIMNLRLDLAIASAVAEWSRRHDLQMETQHASELNQRLGMLGHEMRNQLNTAILALAAIRGGTVGFGGATAAALDRSMIAMRDLIDRSLSDVRLQAADTAPLVRTPIDLAAFIADAQVAAALEATALACELTVAPVESGIRIDADSQILAAAVANLLQNAFKFTRKGGHVVLRAGTRDGRVYIEVEDECGGLPPGTHELMFRPFEQAGANRTGVGLGLAIGRKAVEAHDGRLSVRDLPGRGCVFTIDLPPSRAKPGEPGAGSE